MKQTLKEILTAIIDCLARLGCGLEGLPYENPRQWL